MPENSKFKTSVGGQAVMEGIMMRGPEKWCLAVRRPNDEIFTEEHPVKQEGWRKLPFIRGVFAFVDSMFTGYKTLMRSAEIAMEGEPEQEELSKFDIWLEEKLGDKAGDVIMVLSTVVGLLFAVGMFMVLPTAVVKLLDRFVVLGGWKSVLEGAMKISLFVGYLALVRRMKEIARVFGYHGAEHKTIACYEAGDELTVENIRNHSRFHPRCGTSFLLIVLIISILLFSVLPWSGTFMRVGLKLLCMPLVMGISYEIIRLAGRYNNPVTRAVSAPGLWLQRLTTNEPDDSMIEIAIAAVQPVLPEKPEEAKW